MNKILKEYEIPGYKTLAIIVPRDDSNDSEKKGEGKKYLQLELDINGKP